MGANDAAEMLEVAKAECVRLERRVAELTDVLEHPAPHPAVEREALDRRLRDIGAVGVRMEVLWVNAPLEVVLDQAVASGRLPVVETVTEWAVEYDRHSGRMGYNQFPDRESCERFIRDPSLWFDRRDIQSMRIVSRRKAGDWIPVDGGEADTWRDPDPWFYPVSGERQAHHLAQTNAVFLPRTREQFEQEALAGLTIRKETES